MHCEKIMASFYQTAIVMSLFITLGRREFGKGRMSGGSEGEEG